MAKSLNSTEAEVFDKEILATHKFPILAESHDSLLKLRDEGLDFPPELGFLFGDPSHGTQGF
jgi:hypothetical protein